MSEKSLETAFRVLSDLPQHTLPDLGVDYDALAYAISVALDDIRLQEASYCLAISDSYDAYSYSHQVSNDIEERIKDLQNER